MTKARLVALLAVPAALALLWGFGVPGHAQPGGPDAPARVAAREKAHEVQLRRQQQATAVAAQQKKRELATAKPQESAYLAVLPTGMPTYSASFGGSALNTSLFGTCFPPANSPTGCTVYGNGDDFEWYLPSQDKVSDGMLRLVAERTPTPGRTQSGAPTTFGCRSGMMTTYPSLRFRYGFLQVDAKIPHEPGLWPALWLGAANNQWPPEIDLVEAWNNYTASYFHPYPASIPRPQGVFPSDWTIGWQTYSVYWTHSELEIFVGTHLTMKITARVPQIPMFFLADLAQSRPVYPGTCAGELDIRSIRYWKF